ncbi:MAG: hypothetical protein WC708_09235 [Lentisphaeria bacterium]
MVSAKKPRAEKKAAVPAPHVPLELWRRLYALAARVQEMAPWDWMGEGEIFGVRQPDSGRLDFVSVMGMAGSYRAIALYQGEKALADFIQTQSREFQELDQAARGDALLSIPQIHLSFARLRELTKEDKAVLETLGISVPRGAEAPLFRCIHPGFHKWFLMPEEASALAVALEQVLEIAPRQKQNPDLLCGQQSADEFLIRFQDQPGQWTEARQRLPAPIRRLSVTLSSEAVRAVVELPQRKMTLETAFFGTLSGISEHGGRPARPYLLLLVEPQSGMVVGMDVAQVETSLDDLWATLPGRILQCFQKVGCRPEALAVADPKLAAFLEQPLERFSIRLVETATLPALDEVREHLLARF